MKILVTGGAGFIGSHVVDAYINAGHQVTVVDNLSTGKIENLNPGAKFIKMDIRDKEIVSLFEEEEFDYINHHAAQIDVRRSVADPLFDAEVNILGSINLFQQAVASKVKQIIFASTGGAIYGEQDYFPADENHPLRPISPYGVAKSAVETYLFYYSFIYGVKAVILRYANVYGPRQDPFGEAGVVAIFTGKMLKGKNPVINGDGKQTRDYVYVGDVARANLLALNCSRTDVFNIATGLETDVNTLFYMLREVIGKPDIAEIHGEEKKGEQRRSVLSFEKAQKILGWQPTICLKEGLLKTVDFFKEFEYTG